MICPACQNGTLSNPHPDTIKCDACFSQWKNYSLSASNQKGYRQAKWKEGR